MDIHVLATKSNWSELCDIARICRDHICEFVKINTFPGRRGKCVLSFEEVGCNIITYTIFELSGFLWREGGWGEAFSSLENQ